MTEEQDPSTQYIKGFNHGYILSKKDPELLEQLLKADRKGSEYQKALEAGKRQQKLEKFQEQMKDNAKQQNKDILR